MHLDLLVSSTNSSRWVRNKRETDPISMRGYNYYQYSRNDDQLHLKVLVKHGGINIDLIVSFLLIFIIVCFEIWQAVTYALSVVLLCEYFRTPLWQENWILDKVLGILRRKRLLKPFPSWHRAAIIVWKWSIPATTLGM